MLLRTIKNPQNHADEAYNITAKKCEFFKDQNGELFLMSYCGSGYELKYLSSVDEATDFIRKLYFDKYNRSIKTGDIRTAYELICSNARVSAEVVPVHTRIAHIGDTIFYDLVNNNGEVVEIKSDGVAVTHKAQITDVLFNENFSSKEQKKPVLNGTYSVLDFIDDFFNVPKEQKILLAGYICTAFLPNISHPILIVEGEKGAGKTTLMRFLLKLVHPVNKDVFTLPSKSDNLITTLSNNYFVAFDNVGKLTSEFTNIFCQVSTGGTLVKRKLYTDNTEVSIDIKRLLALNGINLEISQSDLLDRAIILNLQRIPKKNRKLDGDIFAEFEKKLPLILGDIFMAISRALEIYSNVKLEKYPRMADFCKWGYAVSEAIKKGYGDKFLDEYTENGKVATELAVEENPLLESLRGLAETEGEWQGSPTEVLKKLQDSYRDIYIGSSLPKSFPQSAPILTRRLKVLSQELEALGIKVEFGRAKERYIKISKKNKKNIDGIDDSVDKKYKKKSHINNLLNSDDE